MFMNSCTSVRKLIDEGKYDDAIVYSIKKVKGKKNKKTKYVQSIEKAYKKVTSDDLNRITYLKGQKRGNYWANIFDILNNIDDRQTRINPLLPLISKDGYKAEFQFVRVNSLIIEAENKASEYYYQNGLILLEKARNGDKNASKRAYKEFISIKKFKSEYKDVRELIEEAYFLGQEKVLIDVKNQSRMILPKNFVREIKSINTTSLDRKWLKFYTKDEIKQNSYDYIVTLNIKNIDISPEREKIREFEESAEIKDGYKYILDKKGNVKKDSLGNDIKEDKFKKVKAKVFELYRYKSAIVTGDLKIKDLIYNKSFKTYPVNVEAVFESYASRFEGNRNALSKETKRRLRSNPEPFPSDPDLLFLAVDDLKNILFDEINKNLK